MALILSEGEVLAIRFGSACLLAASQWETAVGEQQTTAWRADRIGPVDVGWQAAKPRARGAEFAYPLMLAAMRAVVRTTRRPPPFVAIVDLSLGDRVYLEVARIDGSGLLRQTVLSARSPGSVARAIELLTTDDAEPVFYLGARPFPAGDESRIGALVLPLASHPATLEALVLSGCNPKTALRLVLLSARQSAAALAALGVGLWVWSAGQWWQVQRAIDAYGPGLLQAELQPLKEQLRTLRSIHAGLERDLSQARMRHLPGGRTAGLLRRAASPGARIREIDVTGRGRLKLTLAGRPGPVLETLGRLSRAGRMKDLSFAVREVPGGEERSVSVPVELELNGRGGGRDG